MIIFFKLLSIIISPTVLYIYSLLYFSLNAKLNFSSLYERQFLNFFEEIQQINSFDENEQLSNIIFINLFFIKYISLFSE